MVDVEDDIEVVGEAENGEKAVALTLALKPDVVLMDLKMPVLNGVEAIKRIRAEAPTTRVIILSTFADDDDIYAGIAAGARGYLLKDAPPEQLIQFIRAAYRGESLLHPSVAARILDRFSSLITQAAPIPVGPDQEQPAPSQAGGESAPLALPIIGAPRFTSREMEVLRLMAQGLRNKEIAETLVITERTVKIHVGNILNKLNASNRTEAVTTALKLGLL
jgi:NarL family two-component system response regulator LiaR